MVRTVLALAEIVVVTPWIHGLQTMEGQIWEWETQWEDLWVAAAEVVPWDLWTDQEKALHKSPFPKILLELSSVKLVHVFAK
uniref:Putative secreted protein n=1 Tax=Xenopsylla cheopis TaxID=163159 RepID=A0A6M2DYC8_XENCH